MAHGIGPRYNITQDAYAVGFNASAAALAAYLFTLVNPIAGAIFGAVRTIGSALTERALDKMNIDTHSEQGKVLRVATKILGGVAAAWGVLILAGYVIPFSTAVWLTLATIPAVFLLECGGLPEPRVHKDSLLS